MKQRIVFTVLMVIGVILAIVGCGGGSPYSPKVTFAGANFPLNISAPQTAAPGATVTYTIFGNQLNQAGQNKAQTRAADDIELSVTGGVPAGATASISPSTISPTGQATLTVNTGSTTPGNYNIQVTGTQRGKSKAVFAVLTVSQPLNRFSLTGSSPQSIRAGDNATFEINASQSEGASAAVSGISLVTEGQLPAGVTATFVPPIVATGETASLRVFTTTSTPAGVYVISVRGSLGSEVRTTSVQLTVGEPLFNLTATQTSAQIAGGTFSSTIGAQFAVGQGREAAPIVLSYVSGLPTGVAPPTFTPGSVVVGTESQMVLLTSVEYEPGTYNVVIRGTRGTDIAEVTVPITILPSPSFTVSVSPSTQTLEMFNLSSREGNVVTYVVTVTSQNGYAGTVNLSLLEALPNNGDADRISASFHDTSLVLAASQSAVTNLSFFQMEAGSRPDILFTFTVNGVDGPKSVSGQAQLILDYIEDFGD